MSDQPELDELSRLSPRAVLLLRHRLFNPLTIVKGCGGLIQEYVEQIDKGSERAEKTFVLAIKFNSKRVVKGVDMFEEAFREMFPQRPVVPEPINARVKQQS